MAADGFILGGHDLRVEGQMKIAIANDHGGFALKNELKEFLISEGVEVIDLGTYSDQPVDYPIYGRLCAETVVNGNADRGIVCCGTGIGVAISANRVKGIRCALCTDMNMAALARKHNNANMLALGGRFTAFDVAINITKIWLTTEFEGGRHQRRIDMIDEM